MHLSTTIGTTYTRFVRQASSLRGALPAARIVAAIEVALVVVCAWQVAALMWTIVAPSTLGPAPAPVKPASSSGFVPRLPQVVTLSAVDLFHRSDAGVAPSVAGADAPVTTMALELMGVRANADPTRSSAIIQRPDKSQDAFRIGQEIADGAVLDAVFADRVTIRRHGVRETLPIDKTRALASVPANVPVPVDAARLIDAIQLSAGADGRLVLMPGEDSALFAQAGLAPGDVLVSIDGRPVRDAAALTDIISRGVGNGVDIETERGGRRQVVRMVGSQ